MSTYQKKKHHEIIFFIFRKFREKKKLDTKEVLRKQQEMKISEGYNLINETKL